MKNFWNSLKSITQLLSERYPFLLYFIIAVVVMWPLSLGIYALQYDAVDVYLPWRVFGSESLRQGMVPLWNPFQDGGYPFYADHQYSIWNPELFIISLFTRFNMTTLQWLFIMYLALGGLGFRYLLKQLNVDRSVWFVGGVLFMLSGIMIGHAQSVISILGAVWLPWALGAYIKALNSNFAIKDVTGLILFMFLMLSSGYQAVSIMLFYVVLALGGYTFIQLLRKRDWKPVKRFFVGHVLTMIGLMVLMAGIVFSLIEVGPYLSRLSGISLEDSQLVHFHPASFWSGIYPLASVQDEYQGTAISAQNIFSGIFVFFLLFFAFKSLRKRMNGHLAILLIFGVIYGLAAMGPYTPVQPLLYKILPGCDQFFYASFYRYFTWIALLILVCYGLQNFLEHGKMQHLKVFVGAATLFFVISAVVYWSDWDAMDQAVSHTWAVTFRKMTWGPAVLLESIVHAVLLLIFLAVLFFVKSRRVIIGLMIIELMVISQLNLPVTVHGEITTNTLDNYLTHKKEGFFIPNNGVDMAYNDKFGRYASIWRNQGNFTNHPCLEAWSSFHLVGREFAKNNSPELLEELSTQPFAYFKNDQETPKISAFAPNRVKLKLSGEVHDTLVLQQSMYPSWKVRMNGSAARMVEVNDFQMGVLATEGAKEVEFSFENKRMQWLYYVSSFGFLVVLFIYIIQHTNAGSVMMRSSVFGVLFVGIAVRFFTFGPTRSEGFELKTAEGSLTIRTNLANDEYQRVTEFLLDAKEGAQLINHNADTDPKLLAIASYIFPQTTRETGMKFSKGAFIDDTARIEIPATGFYNIDLNEELPDQELMGHLLFGFDVHDVEASKDLFVVIELREEDRLLYYAPFPMKAFLEGNGRKIFADGWLLPSLGGKREIKMYLWNNSSDVFTFSNFRAKIIE